jgi:hypothetical protein
MINDPIIDEIRKIRREIEAECGHDAENYFIYLQNIQKKYKNLVRRAPKPRLQLKKKHEGMPA